MSILVAILGYKIYRIGTDVSEKKKECLTQYNR